jgi:rod shape-determining protein MreC
VHDTRRTRLFLGALLVAALALITLNARGGLAGPIGGLRGAGGAVFGFGQTVAGSVTRPVASFFDRLTGAGSSGQQVTTLQREVVALRAQLGEARLSKAQEAQLQQLLQLAGRGGYRVVAANVIAAALPYGNSVTIDAGSADGIKPEETVLNGDGLVGTVTAVTAHTSTVLLASDASSVVGVRLAGTGQIGAVTGPGRSRSGLLRLQIFDASAVLQVGQQLVTFGSVNGRPYVPGVPVGVITQVQPDASALTKTALVRPYASLGSLSVVGVVIVPPRTDPRDSVLPPSPRPAPSPSRTSRASPSPAASATPTSGG